MYGVDDGGREGECRCGGGRTRKRRTKRPSPTLLARLCNERNRVLSVGDASRGARIAQLLDPPAPGMDAPFVVCANNELK